MTFDTGVPNSGQSPGFFPAQNQTNMTRIKANINADHNFLDTSAVDEGAHKQTTFINKTAGYSPAFPAGTNAIMYTLFDANNESQLHYYNGVTDEILTPRAAVGPLKIQGNTGGNIAFNAVFAIPGLPAQFVGTGYAWQDGLNVFTYYTLFLINGNTNNTRLIREPDSSTQPIVAPSLTFDGGVTLKVRNNSVIAQKIWWSLIINEVP